MSDMQKTFDALDELKMSAIREHKVENMVIAQEAIRELQDAITQASFYCPHASKHILEAKYKELEASFKSTGCCVVCWTTSWEPVENKEDCTIAEHPHPEEGCLRCGYCAQEKAYKELKTEVEQLQIVLGGLAEKGIVT